jgi:RNA polymerase primary sigma factor
VFDGRKRVGFLASSVDRFVQAHPERVRRGARFSQLDEEERRKIVGRARRLARAGGCPADVAKRLAKNVGRSIETIRYTLKQFDREYPDLAVFPDLSGPLQESTKRKIYQRYRRGTQIEELAKKFCRTKASIYRIVGEMRAQAIMELPLDFMPNDKFPRIRTEKQRKAVLGPMPANDQPVKKSRFPTGLPPYLASLYEVPLLTREQETHLFRKMNYLKYQASKLRQELDPGRPRSGLMDAVEKVYNEAVATKNEIVSANLRLVVSIAKRHVGPTENFFELVSDGNISLIRAAEKFDFARGNKFSTYASWAIMKNFARTIPNEHKLKDRFRTSHSEMFGTTEDIRTDQHLQESSQLRREAEVARILGQLDEREQQIIIRRFGLSPGQEPRTLKQVGAELGVTKERIRQIEARALHKLRKAAEIEKIEIPGLN